MSQCSVDSNNTGVTLCNHLTNSWDFMPSDSEEDNDVLKTYLCTSRKERIQKRKKQRKENRIEGDELEEFNNYLDAMEARSNAILSMYVLIYLSYVFDMIK